jgi:hypothetical protein
MVNSPTRTGHASEGEMNLDETMAQKKFLTAILGPFARYPQIHMNTPVTLAAIIASLPGLFSGKELLEQFYQQLSSRLGSASTTNCAAISDLQYVRLSKRFCITNL